MIRPINNLLHRKGKQIPAGFGLMFATIGHSGERNPPAALLYDSEARGRRNQARV